MYIKAKENYFESFQGFINYNAIYNSLGRKTDSRAYYYRFKISDFSVHTVRKPFKILFL